MLARVATHFQRGFKACTELRAISCAKYGTTIVSRQLDTTHASRFAKRHAGQGRGNGRGGATGTAIGAAGHHVVFAGSCQNESGLVINLGALLDEFNGLRLHTFVQCFLFRHAFLRGKFAHFLRDFHRAEMRAAHGAEMRHFG